MEKTIKHKHYISGSTIFFTTLAVLYILQRLNIKEVIYSTLIYFLILTILEWVKKSLDWVVKKLDARIKKLETELEQ